jgi:glycosyltransferase involved in cell wall biosynthesis
VEALASGKPVIALGRGGVLESVPLADPLGGLFYQDATDAALSEAIERWERREEEIQLSALQAYAARFSEAEFAKKMGAILFSAASPSAPG